MQAVVAILCRSDNLSCRQDATTALRSTGMRVTSARLAVITALRHTGAHMTTSEVIAAARKDVPHIDPSTVYRTLAELASARLVAETRLGHGESFYEWTGEDHHHHLRCDSCGALADLDPDAVASFTCRVRALHGFELNADHLVLSGTCASCAQARR